MMTNFKPIVHNLTPGTKGYTECQLYNNLVANKPRGDGTLVSKLAAIRAWEDLCNQALERVKESVL